MHFPRALIPSLWRLVVRRAKSPSDVEVVVRQFSLRSNCTSTSTGSLVLIFAIEIARCYGTGVTKKAISHLFERINPNVKDIHATLQAGRDPGGITLRNLGGRSG